jgi:hypothetical protein
MVSRFHLSALVAISFLVGHCHADGIERVVEMITKNRNAIDDYHLVFVQDLETVADARGKREFSKIRYEIWRKGIKTRIDSLVIASTDKDSPADLRTIWCRNCEKEGHILRTSYRAGHFSTPIAFEPIESYSPTADMTNINWPWLGLSNSVHLPWYAIPQDAFLQSIVTKDPELVFPIGEATERLGDVNCRRFTLMVKQSSAKFVMWVDPSGGNSPIRMERTNPKGEFESESNFTYAAKPVDKIWFPSSITQRLVANRDRRSTITVELAEFNRKIDDSVFTYGALGLLRDTPVMIDGITDVSKAPRLRDGKLVYPDRK